MCSQGRGTIGRSAQGQAGLDGHRVRLRSGFGRGVGGDIVAGQSAGQLVIAEGFVVARRGEVPRPAVAARQDAVRDLADERLDEVVLAALRRPRVDLEMEQLTPDQDAQARLQGRDVVATDGCQARPP